MSAIRMPQGGDPTAVDSSAATPSFQMKGVMPSQQAAEVTPPEGGDEPHKQVRFGAAAAVDAVERTETRSRGAVSRRGRYVSPGRRALDLGSTSPVNDAVTGKQPQEVLSYQTFRSPSRSKEQDVPSLCSTGSEVGGDQSKQAPAQHIQVSASEATTSPLAAPDVVGGKKPVTRQATKKMESSQLTPPRGSIRTVPSLEEASKSPAGLFLQLSPHPPATSSHIREETEEKKRDDADDVQDSKPSPRERYVATPTDFALDYGKGHHVTGSFDTSNVLAWLQSPTANGLFSPGGLNSVMNTPAGSKTPRTPTVSTSFFFSDVASLPAAQGSPGKKTSSSSQKGISNIICISPLASNRKGTGATPGATPVPVNLRDVFASPKQKEDVRSLPLLNDDATPAKSHQPRVPRRTSSKDPSLDAVQLANQDLMEDEDLSVLLQLASNNTPRGRAAGDPVFRGKEVANAKEAENLPAPIQLPMIGGRDDAHPGATRLERRSKSRGDPRANPGDFAPPQLGMRSSSTNDSKEIYVGGRARQADKPQSDNGDGDRKKSGKKNVSSPSRYPMQRTFPPHHGAPPFFSMPGDLPPGMPPGPAGSMRVVVGGPPPPPPPGSSRKGSPNRPGGSPLGPPHYPEYPPSGMPYPPPHGMYSSYPPAPPPPPHHHMGGGFPPYSSHFPPPPPRGPMGGGGAVAGAGGPGMYGGPSSVKGPGDKKDKKKSKSGTKRGSPMPEKGSSKKKKSPVSKRKNKSPQLTDKHERQKAAEAIQAVNAASGGKNDKAAALAAAILRGVTMRPSGKWQAQLYFAGKSRYIGVFDSREKAALAYEIAREKLKTGCPDGTNGKSTENLVNAARKAAFDGVNERG